jgi:hypothetical protein
MQTSLAIQKIAVTHLLCALKNVIYETEFLD